VKDELCIWHITDLWYNRRTAESKCAHLPLFCDPTIVCAFTFPFYERTPDTALIIAIHIHVSSELIVQQSGKSGSRTIIKRSENMQQVKMYTSGMFKGDARTQFDRDLKKMQKDGWHVQNVNDEGVGRGQDHTGKLKVVYEK